MRIIFMGTPDFAVPALERLIGSGYEVTAVYTQPDKAAGRGRVVEEPPVKKAALQHHLTVMQPDNFKSAETRKQLALLKPDVIVVAAYRADFTPICVGNSGFWLPQYSSVDFAKIPRGRTGTGGHSER